MTGPADAEIEKVARLSYGRLVATLAVRTGSVDAAADLLSEALVRALETWPERGIPERPEAWLIAAARNRATDAGRRAAVAQSAEAHLALLEEERAEMAEAATPDRTLNLMFVCAHPAIDARMRTPLMLQLVLGLDARRMAGAFLIPPGTLGQRLTRARAKIEAARIGFALPAPEDMAPRLSHVLDAVYAAYTVGSDGHAAGDAKASSLAQEALWLASLLAARMPDEAEAQALFALMLYGEARRPARTDAEGRFVPLEAQDPTLWDSALLADASAALHRAHSNRTLGRYQIEAAIQAAHADRRHGRPTDWAAIAALYRGLVALHPTTGALVGLAAALGECDGPAAGLALLETADAARAVSYQPWWAVRAHLLASTGDTLAAADAYDRAIALSSDASVRDFLARRKAALERS
jgi:RNA polymerase sigma-70 factor (ECF subfamily)